ncbi:uncharacterized protein LOC122521604 isoform X1 [Polistes fuscatus]|uniref:uncharacterized protein LOC122521604 isoform X1 n=1 Tax=Polistes fuscatus TaxID=30207 RepID=UPI001CA7F399|nr:uncharacterized protein LOC122521604 isoform X1 [Polistes fuscatus]
MFYIVTILCRENQNRLLCPSIYLMNFNGSQGGVDSSLDSSSTDRSTLSVFTGETSMMVKKSDQPEGRIKSTLPIAMPLKRNYKLPKRRGDHYEEKGKDTKISKIFQLAVTALSFLAFGGYLLTLIITAIRRNSNAANTGNVIVFSNLQSPQKNQRLKRNLLIYDPTENNFQTDKLYQGMIMLSRTCARFER